MIGTQKDIWMSRLAHLIESVGDALEEGVAGAAVRNALRVRREIFAHDDGLVLGVVWCYAFFGRLRCQK